MKLSRRTLLSTAAVGGAGLLGFRCMIPWFLRPGPLARIEELSPGARALVAEAFEGVDAERMWDVHTHVVGLGRGDSGCWVNPRMRSHLHPIERLRFEIYFSSAGVRHEATADDAQYANHQLRLRTRVCLLRRMVLRLQLALHKR